MDKKAEERMQKTKELYLKGFKVEQISESLGVKVSTVRTYITKLGLKKKEWEKISKRVAEMYKAGKEIKEITEELNVTQPYINRVLKKMGIPTRKRHMADPDLIDENTKFAEDKAVCEKIIVKGNVFLKNGNMYRKKIIYTDITQKVGGI